jgi:hypothetical protein
VIHPDDEERPFAARWNALVGALLIEPSIKLVARQAVDYGFLDGDGIYPGNERIARQTGLGDKTVREAWHFLRAAEMARRDLRSVWTGTKRLADMYALEIPANWKSMPVLGPHAARFTCQQCGKKFNAPPCNTFLHKQDPHTGRQVPVTNPETGLRQVRWALWKAVFCPAPRNGTSCQQLWEKVNGRWAADPAACWELFHKARDDEWPEPP